MSTINTLSNAQPIIPEGLTDRQSDMLEGILSIAELAGPDWAERARASIVALCATGEDQSVGVQLLSSCREIFESKDRDSLSTTDLLNALVCVEDANAPWPIWWANDIKRDNIHAPASKLAKLLEPFGVKPRMVMDAMQEEAKGYWRADFDDCFARYLPPLAYATKELF